MSKNKLFTHMYSMCAPLMNGVHRESNTIEFERVKIKGLSAEEMGINNKKKSRKNRKRR